MSGLLPLYPRKRTFGEGAAIQAAMRADDMLDKGDLDGTAVWRQIVAAVNDLQREKLEPGERRH